MQRDQSILQTRKQKIRNEDTSQAPKFIIRPKSKDCMEGNSCRFVCEVVGNPPPSVTWSFAGRELFGGGRFKVSGATGARLEGQVKVERVVVVVAVDT